MKANNKPVVFTKRSLINSNNQYILQIKSLVMEHGDHKKRGNHPRNFS